MYDAIDEAHSINYLYNQEDRESNAKHLCNFKSIVSAIEHLGVAIFADGALVSLDRKKKENTGESGKDNVHFTKVVTG